MFPSSRAREHPLVAAVRAVGELLDQTAGVDPLYLSARDKSQLLVELTRSLARVAAIRQPSRCEPLQRTAMPMSG